MKDVAIDTLLVVAVLSAWIAGFGFLRLRWSLDRLHAAAFVTMATGFPIVVAGFVADGLSIRTFKLAFLWIVTLVTGATLNHAIARAIFNRKEKGEMS